MNSRQDNKLSMYNAVQKACRNNPTEWNTIPAATRVFSDFENCMLALDDLLESLDRLLV